MFASKFAVDIGTMAVICLYSHAVMATDVTSSELDSLKRALEAPAVATPVAPKKRTRAIVFDNEPSPSPSLAGPQISKPESQAVPQTAEAIRPPAMAQPDCTQVINSSGLAAKPIPFSIQFMVGSADISPVSRDVLSSIGSLLQSMLNNRCILIEGHTDISGNFDRNMELSAARANSVVNFLVQNYSIPKQNIVSTGKGPTEILPGIDPSNPRNRRVVFKIIG